MGFWGIDVLVTTQRGRPVAMMKSLNDDSHVVTRVAQYDALTNGKGNQIAKQLVLSKIQGQEWIRALRYNANQGEVTLTSTI